MMKKWLAWGLVFAVSAAVLSGCGQEDAGKAAAEKPLRVGMDASYAPFGSQNMDTKEYEGYDVDIIRAIGEEEGIPLEIVNLNFDGLIPALQTGDLDIVINDMTITPEREKNVLFSEPYYIAGLGIVTRADDLSIGSAADLSGKRVGVSIGSTGEEAAPM